MKPILNNLPTTKLAIFFYLLFPIEVFSQELSRILQFDDNMIDILLDGFVNESIWQGIPAIDGMKISDPDTLVDAPYKTDIRFFYTESGIYFSMVNHQPQDSLVARMTSRDSFLERDTIGIIIDASGEGLFGYGVSLALGLAFSRLPYQWLFQL